MMMILMLMMLLMMMMMMMVILMLMMLCPRFLFVSSEVSSVHATFWPRRERELR